MTKQLLLIRHAHRDKPLNPRVDNGLSAKGTRQKLKVLHFFMKRFEKCKPKILSSPKRRCMETVAPIAMSTGVKVTASALLDEGSALRTRALKMLARLKKDPAPLVVLSSHGDWLPTFLEVLGFEGEIGKGGWVLIEFQPGVETKITSCGHATLHKLHSSDRIL